MLSKTFGANVFIDNFDYSGRFYPHTHKNQFPMNFYFFFVSFRFVAFRTIIFQYRRRNMSTRITTSNNKKKGEKKCSTSFVITRVLSSDHKLRCRPTRTVRIGSEFGRRWNRKNLASNANSAYLSHYVFNIYLLLQ